MLGSALLTSVLSSSTLAQITANLPGKPAVTAEDSISLAGDLIDNVLVPRTGNPLTEPSTIAPFNLGSFDIVINAGPTLAGNAAALAAFNRAAVAWEARISDSITVTIAADLGTLGPGILGSTSSVILQGPYTTIRDQMVVDGANEADDSITASLPTALQFTATIPAGRSLSGNLLGSKANLKALGFTGLDVTFGVTDATITFSNSFAFDFDNSDGVVGIDFETVAAHELGHALGFFSIVDSVNAGQNPIPPVTLDLFRFADGTAEDPTTIPEFTTFPRNLVPGVTAITDEINGSPERQMSTGLTNPSFPGTDGRQASHWKDDDLSGFFIGLMDPTLASGQFYGPQDSDFRALDLIGYEIISLVPESNSVLVALSLVGLVGWRVLRKA